MICGFGGNDVLIDLAGDDLVIGGAGRDVLLGGAGSDLLVEERAPIRCSVDRGPTSSRVATMPTGCSVAAAPTTWTDPDATASGAERATAGWRAARAMTCCFGVEGTTNSSAVEVTIACFGLRPQAGEFGPAYRPVGCARISGDDLRHTRRAAPPLPIAQRSS